ncbi:ARM repeat-containing protein [Auricularia subglabra TFB-10046 SS5]|nr:ARM repeat-containing protein [Auricularia subglabra TFB-10046 SS5]
MASAISQIVAVAQAVPVLAVDDAVLPPAPSSAGRRSASPPAEPEREPASDDPDAQGLATPRLDVPPAVALAEAPRAPPRDTAPLRLAIPSEDEAAAAQELAEQFSPLQPDDPALELCLDGELSVVERVYLFAQSNSVFHRLYIARELPALLPDAPPGDAVIYILPLLNPLATDTDAVKETLVTGIADIIWWFFSHCAVVEEDPPEGEHDPPVIAVTSFTPLLGSLLMNPTTTVGSSARAAVVELLNRLRTPECWPTGEPTILDAPTRALIEAELVYEVIVGLGRLEYMDAARADPPENAQSQAEILADRLAEVVREGGRTSTAEAVSTPDAHSAALATSSWNGLDFPTLSPVPESIEEPALPDASALLPFTVPLPPSPGQPSTDSFADDVPILASDAEQAVSQALIALPHQTAATRSDVASSSRTAHTDELASAAPNAASENDARVGDSRLATAGSSGSTVSSPALIEKPGGELAVIDLTAHVAADNPQEDRYAGESSPSDDTRASTSFANMFRIPTPPRSGAQALPRQPDGAAGAQAATPTEDPPVKRIPSPEPDHTTTTSSPSTTSPLTPTAPSISQSPTRTLLTTFPGHDSPPHLSSTDSAHTYSRSAPPNHIALPPQGVFRPQNLDLEPQTTSPPHAPDSDVNTALALFPGTPFPQGGEVGDPLLEHVPGRDQPPNWARADLDEGITSDDCAIGRLSCMSLIATVTTQATKTLTEEVQTCFVEEVTRVKDDPEFWVRREATLALGALAKVVPEGVVQTYLLPLFERWLHDTTWNVRQAAIFTLPNILNRLPPVQRRSLALNVLPQYAKDDNETVRASVLEILGEVIYAFKDDDNGPPAEILNLYLGDSSKWAASASDGLWSSDSFFKPDYLSSVSAAARDPSRELTCAFNFPAIALTLGKTRWAELRDFYLYLSHSSTHKVRRTIAASLGEVANIIGDENASRDLVPVWRRSVSSDDGDIRLKALDCLPHFIQSLAQRDRDDIAGQLDDLWVKRLRGWREREVLTGHLCKLAMLLASHWNTIRSLLFKALRDPVAAVRDAAIDQVANCFYESGVHLDTMRGELAGLAESSSFRDRHTYTTCCVAIYSDDRGFSELGRPEMWQALSQLAHDRIVDVRIGVARAVGGLCDLHYKDHRSRPAQAQALILQLARDESDVVRSFVRHLTSAGSLAKRPPLRSTPSLFATFHDPPPATTHESVNGHTPPVHEGNGHLAPDLALHDTEPLLTPGSTYDLPSSIDWTTNTSLMDESLSQDDNLSDESFGTLDVPWPDGDPFADPPSRPESPKWFGTP